jgi:hypothetical protein
MANNRKSKRRMRNRANYTRKNRKSVRRTRMSGGSCGCGKEPTVMGGSANLAELSKDNHYVYNKELISPPAPSYGGQRQRRRLRLIRGGATDGGILDTLSKFAGSDQVRSFGTFDGIYDTSRFISATPMVDSSSHVQPILSKYNEYNPPLV